jgi:hypothetical protein
MLANGILIAVPAVLQGVRMLESRVALDEVLPRLPTWEVGRDDAVQARISTGRGWERLPVITS